MAFRVETVLLGPEDGQYTGDVQPAIDVARIRDSARAAERLGFDGLTVPEAGHDPYLPLAIAAEHTERVKLGTNVAIAFPRSPLVTAQLAWDLQALSGGRFELGLGTQVRSHVERRYAADWTAPPGPRLRDYVSCIKAMFEVFQTGARPGAARTIAGEARGLNRREPPLPGVKSPADHAWPSALATRSA